MFVVVILDGSVRRSRCVLPLGESPWIYTPLHLLSPLLCHQRYTLLSLRFSLESTPCACLFVSLIPVSLFLPVSLLRSSDSVIYNSYSFTPSSLLFDKSSSSYSLQSFPRTVYCLHGYYSGRFFSATGFCCLVSWIMIQKLTLNFWEQEPVVCSVCGKVINIYLRTTVVGYFVPKFILKADYRTLGSEFDIFSSWIGRCLK